MEPMSVERAWATATLIAALPLALVIAPVLSELAVRLRRRLGIGGSLRRNAGG